MDRENPGTRIVVDNVNVALLYEQREYLLSLPSHEHLTGLINLLDDMLDAADGSS